MLVYWEEESSTSIVKASQIVEPLQPKKGSKSKVKWGKRVLPATVLEVGGKEKLKKMQREFHKKQMCNEEVLEEITATAPPKKRKCAEASSSKNKKGKKEVTILCVTKPAEQVPVPSPPATTPAIDVEEPLPGTSSPEVPIQHTRLRKNYCTTSYEIRLNFVRTSVEVRDERTSHGNIIFAPTVLPMIKSEIKDTLHWVCLQLGTWLCCGVCMTTMLNFADEGQLEFQCITPKHPQCKL